jgi:hypothetical protein
MGLLVFPHLLHFTGCEMRCSHTLSVCNEHVIALVHRPQKLLFEVWILPFELSNVTPRLALRSIEQGSPQFGRKSNLAPPDQFLNLLIPSLDLFSLYRLDRNLVYCTQRRHIPAPEAKIRD